MGYHSYSDLESPAVLNHPWQYLEYGIKYDTILFASLQFWVICKAKVKNTILCWIVEIYETENI